MRRWLRRLFWFGLLAVVGGGVYQVMNRRRTAAVTNPVWPEQPVATTEPATRPAAAAPKPSASRAAAPKWVEPVDGVCPDGYPIKANNNSRIFHVPGGRFYDRTVAERCYARADDAVADGYRPAKA